jgi:hypothetical protein
VGTLVGKTLGVVADYAERQLSLRERTRIGAAFAFAFDRVRIYLEQGRKPRTDAAFNLSSDDHRSEAASLLEGVVQVCRGEHQERKCRHLAAVFANTAFSDTPPATAMFVLELGERLTYRQMALLSLMGRTREFQLGALSEFTRGDGNGDPVLRFEFQELGNRYHLTEQFDNPELTRLGRTVFELLSLDELNIADARSVLAEVQTGLRWYGPG